MGEGFRLHPLHQSDMALADLVLVHGLKGHHHATWTHKDGQKCWPEWLARKYPQSNIWLADYGTSLSGWLQPALPVEDIGRALLSHAADLKIGTRPVHWVGHSMGGLVIKQLLCQARVATQPNWNAISAATRAVTFLGTPHHGADLPVWKSYFKVLLEAVDMTQLGGITTLLSRTVSKVLGERHSQVDALARHAPALGRLNADFAEWLMAAQSPGQALQGPQLHGRAADFQGRHGGAQDGCVAAQPAGPGHSGPGRSLGHLQVRVGE
jgi:pimeloyl-ACP methyl ester carboxylesterase